MGPWEVTTNGFRVFMKQAHGNREPFSHTARCRGWVRSQAPTQSEPASASSWNISQAVYKAQCAGWLVIAVNSPRHIATANIIHSAELLILTHTDMPTFRHKSYPSLYLPTLHKSAACKISNFFFSAHGDGEHWRGVLLVACDLRSQALAALCSPVLAETERQCHT